MSAFRQSFFLGFFLLSTTAAWSFGSRAPQPSPVEDPTPVDLTPVQVDAATLKSFLFRNNSDLLLASNNVHRSKDQVAQSRAKLFPSLQLSAVAALSTGNFLVPAIEILLPFLVPSRWFEAAQSKNQLEADTAAYQTLQKNTLASALSLQLAMLSDQDLKSIFEKDWQDWKQLETYTRRQYALGLISSNDLALTISQRALAELRVVKLDSSLTEQKQSLKQSLGLDPRRELVLQAIAVDVLPEEKLNFEELMNLAWERSSEVQQMKYLAEATRKDRWSRVFGFYTNFSLSATASGSQNFPNLGFDRMQAGADFNLSFAQIPAVKIANKNLVEVQLRLQALQREMGKTVQNFLEQYRLIQQRYSLAKEAEDLLRRNFDNQLRRYRLGDGIDFEDVLRSRLGIQEASVNRLSADLDRKLSRITLQRLLSTGYFSDLPAVPQSLIEAGEAYSQESESSSNAGRFHK